ncbi:MAG: S9 family peptidase [Acidobacteria bacterium]|nr:S9 family peptidase [Acidobacteriota bacterium]
MLALISSINIFRLILFLVCLVFSSSVAAERFNLEHAAKIANVFNPQISPDGKSIVVAVSRANLKDNRYDTELVQVDVATKKQKILTRRQASLHRWSPDGTRLAFLAPADGKSQIWVLPIDGGEAMQVSKPETGVRSFDWRPDGKAFVYSAVEEAPKREGEEKSNRSFEADVNYLSTEAPRASHLWLVPAEGGESKRLTSGTWSVIGNLGLRWSPDGRRIAFGYQPGPGERFFQDQTSRVVDIETGALTALSGRTKLDSAIGFSPDGQHFSYSWPRDGDTRFGNEIWVMPAGGGPARNLTRALDSDAFAQWAPDSKSLYVFTQQGTSNVMWRQPLDGPARRLDTGRLGSFGVSVSKSGRLALAASEPDRPFDLYYKETPDSPPQRLTDFNAEIAALELGKQEPIRWRGPDNFEMDGIVTYPPGYRPGKPYPLVLAIHGGPRGASTLGFGPRPQWLAAQGWVVFEPNYRGSSNLGNAFQAAIWNDAGAGPGRDVMSGVDLLIQRGIADSAKMAVSGWSYGGYMTTWLLGNYPDHWRAGVAGAAVTDHLDQYALSDIHSNVATYYGGSPFTDPKRLQAYRDQAPITYASKIKAPTLILSDTGDQRVPITESYLLYHVLRDNGVKTKFIAYPVSGHAPSDPIHQRDINRRWAEWIQEHLEAPK